MVVEEARDVLAVEKAGTFKGIYHVLGGTIRLAQGIGPEKLNISALVKRVRDCAAREVILATNLTHEGNITAMYIRRELEGIGCSVTRIASGIPIGTEIEFADTVTLSEAIRGRTAIDKE
jgi:recombination protein RecR